MVKDAKPEKWPGPEEEMLSRRPRTRGELQKQVLAGGRGEDLINVRLVIDGSDADGVRHFDETLPISVVQALIDPEVENFYVPIKGMGRLKPPRARQHYLHSQYIREIILLDDLPEEGRS